MKRGDKEFEELMKQFERDLPILPLYVGGKIEREARDCPAYYKNGNVNNLFKVYMTGYQLAKSMARTGALNIEG